MKNEDQIFIETEKFEIETEPIVWKEAQSMARSKHYDVETPEEALDLAIEVLGR